MLIIIIFLLVNYVSADEEDGKYIDLLPEKEKADFLDQIARRILDEVNTKDARYKESSELTDDQLEKHNDFVRKILDEETKNLRKHESKKDLNVIPLNKNEENNDGYIDLTLRSDGADNITQTGRRVFDGYIADESSDQDENKQSPTGNEESDVDIQVKNFNKEEVVAANEDHKIDSLNSEEEKHFSTQNKNSSSEESTTQNTPNFDEIPTTEDEIITTTTTQTSFDDDNENKTSNESKVADSVTYEETTSTTVTDDYTTEKIISITETMSIESKPRFSRSSDGDTFITTNSSNDNFEIEKYKNNSENQNNSKVINIEVATLDTTSDNVDIESTTSGITVTESDSPITQITTTEKPVVENITSINVDFNILTSTKIPEALSTSFITEINTEKQPETTTRLDILTTELPSKYVLNREVIIQDNSSKISVYNNISKLDKGTDQNSSAIPGQDTTPVARIVDNMLNTLRVNLLRKSKVNNEKESKYSKPFYEVEKNKEYNVYEIPANSSPFLKQSSKSQQQKTIEQPYYVPVYKYSPNNAFYNPRNRLGPDDYHKESDITIKDDVYQKPIEWDYFFSDDYNKKRLGTKYKSKNKKGQLQRIQFFTAKNLSLINSYINSEDYSDVDYYNKNSEKHFRSRCDENDINFRAKCNFSDENKTQEVNDTQEENEKEKISHSLSNIRQFLIQKHLLSVPPPTYKPEIPTSEDEEEKEKNMLLRLRINEAKRNPNIAKNLYEQQYNGKIPRYVYVLPREKRSVISRKTPDSLLRDCLRYKNKCSFRTFLGFIHTPVSMTDGKSESKSENTANDLSQDKPDQGILDESPVMLTKGKNEKQVERGETDYDMMRKILEMVDARDLIPTMLKLKQLNLKKKVSSRKTEAKKTEISKDVNVYVNIIEDKIQSDDKGLINFDWLGTSVDLQSAIKKLHELVATIRHNEDIYPSDLELLKYLIYIHKTAKQELENIAASDSRSRKAYLPRSKKKKSKYVTARGLIQNRVWLVRMVELVIPEQELNDFQQFLEELESALFDLHTAIKYISTVTTYTHQYWFKNLKELHQFTKKQSVELLVHIIASRILVLIESSAKNGLQYGHLDYIKNNLETVETTEKEFVILLKLLHELKYLE